MMFKCCQSKICFNCSQKVSLEKKIGVKWVSVAWGFWEGPKITEMPNNRVFWTHLTVDPRADVKDEDTWFFFIVLSVRGGQGE